MIGPTPGDAIVAGQALGLLGTLLVALTILGTADLAVGAAIAVASATMLFGWPVAWLGFGLAWTVVGVLLSARRDPYRAVGAAASPERQPPPRSAAQPGLGHRRRVEQLVEAIRRRSRAPRPARGSSARS